MASVAPAAADTSASHPYTCNTCQVAYRNSDLQKGHMKSDWHRYNLKRRVASLPPISSDTFTEKVIEARAVSTAEADKAYFERTCEPCTKTYYSANAYQNHLLSQKHKTSESAAGQRTDDDTTSLVNSTFSLGDPVAVNKAVDSDAEDEFSEVVKGFKKSDDTQQRPSPVKRPSNPQPTGDSQAESSRDTDSDTPVQDASEPSWTVNSCIFCNYTSPSAPLNAQHMERFHGMFIPEKAYLSDLDGLFEQLQRKVHEYHQCLFCDKAKANAFAVQTHMRDTGHCKIPYGTQEEMLDIGDFYDFRSTYSDDEEESDSGSEEEEEDQGGAKLSARRLAKVAGADAKKSKSEEADGWETDSSASSLDSADLTAVPAEGHYHQFERLSKHPHHARNGKHAQVDGFHSHAHKHTHAVFHDDYELHLPSGKSVGHRSLNKYYRQNLNNYPTPEERAEREAIEAANEDQSDDGQDQSTTTTNGRGRQVVPRGARGIAGVSEQKKANLRRDQERGRKMETITEKKTQYAYSKKLNNHKNYYYRELGGG